MTEAKLAWFASASQRIAARSHKEACKAVGDYMECRGGYGPMSESRALEICRSWQASAARDAADAAQAVTQLMTTRQA